MEENDKLEKDEKSNWGGKREGSGRKPLLDKEELLRVKELIAQHGSEFDEIQGKERVLALMDALYEEGINKRNIAAIKEYFDRQMGKSKDSLDVTTNGKDLQSVLVKFLDDKPTHN